MLDLKNKHDVAYVCVIMEGLVRMPEYRWYRNDMRRRCILSRREGKRVIDAMEKLGWIKRKYFHFRDGWRYSGYAITGAGLAMWKIHFQNIPIVLEVGK